MNFIAFYLYGVSKQFISLARGVAAIDGVEAVFVLRAYYAAHSIQPTIAKVGTGMGAKSGKSHNGVVPFQQPNPFFAYNDFSKLVFRQTFGGDAFYFVPGVQSINPYLVCFYDATFFNIRTSDNGSKMSFQIVNKNEVFSLTNQ